jgi:glycosyltransferase involved in cell wall biosynthesis
MLTRVDQHRSDLTPLPAVPRVTVITICKDRAWCIDECVRSVLAQDYPNVEYLVQDGASRDNTLDVLKKYEDRVKVVSEPDRGPIDAFHKALAVATGDIFCLLLSDERFADDKVISRAVEAFHRYPDTGVIYGDFRAVDVDYREIRIERKRQITFEQIFRHDDFISPCAAFVRTETLRQNGTPKPDLRSFFGDVGDWGLWVYVASQYPITHVPQVMADFMVHPDEGSYGLELCRNYVRECETAIRSFHSDAYTPRDLAALKKRSLARVYLNFGNSLAGKYFSVPIQLAWKGISTRPQLIFTKSFLGVVVKCIGLYSLWPARADGKRMKQQLPRESQ